MSPLLYDWYVNELVSALSSHFGAMNIFAYADDIAILCLGVEDTRRALRIVDEWAKRNGASLNKKKCGILPISKRETRDKWIEIQGVPIVKEYKYLGIPLDQAFTLKHLLPLLKKKINRFGFKIKSILHNVLGTPAKFNLW